MACRLHRFFPVLTLELSITNRMATQVQENPTREHLAEELKNLAREAEELLRGPEVEVAQKAEDLQQKLAAALEMSQTLFGVIEQQAGPALKAADRAIRRNPYPSIGIALGAGVLLGFMLKRK